MKRKWVQKIAVALCVSMVSCSLLACGSEQNTTDATDTTGNAGVKENEIQEDSGAETQADETTKEVEEERPQGKLTVLIGDNNGDNGETAPLMLVCKEYEKVNPDAEIEYIIIDADGYGDKINVMLAAEEDVDIIMPNYNPFLLSLINNGYLEPLGSYIEESGMDLEETFSGYAEALRYEGELYALPFTVNEYLVYYNKDMFDEKGIPYPTNDMTWEEYGEICKKMTSGSGTDKVYGGFFQNWTIHYTSLATCDGQHTLCEYDDYAWMKPSLNFLLDLQENGYIMDFSTVTANSLRFDSVFVNKQAATVYTGTWLLGLLSMYEDTLDFDYGIVKAPYWKETGTPGDNSVAPIDLAINSSSKNKELAWDLLEFVSTSEECSRLLASTGWFPAHSTEKSMEEVLKLPTFPEDGMDAFCSTNYYLELPLDQNSSEVNSLADDLVSMIFTGSATVDEAIADFAKSIGELPH